AADRPVARPDGRLPGGTGECARDDLGAGEAGEPDVPRGDHGFRAPAQSGFRLDCVRHGGCDGEEEMKKMIAILWIGASAVGCSSPFSRDEMSAALQEERKLFTDDDDVAKIEQLKPQIKAPFRLAVAPLIQVTGRYWYEPRGMMEGEREEIAAWGEKLKQEGILSELLVIPNMLMDFGVTRNGASYVKAVRVAAARLQADAVLFLRCVTDTESTANPLAFLDITIVGMFLIPGHH